MNETTPDSAPKSYYYPPTDNLDTLGTLFLVKGILTLLVSFFFLIYAAMGTMVTSFPHVEGSGMPTDFGMIFVTIGVVGIVVCVTLAILHFMVRKYIKERSHYTFIFAMAIVSCLTGILGILLGIFTLIDLNKPHVKEQFGQLPPRQNY
ncbi:hypothetical protein [Nonlabens xiamenensis]|uniref:hypothetical protein n=1 Tax=Nonlabens xiamenensis TaxID=2341043 RepID=UPI000F60CBDA|nr:hypothetical protein [Nonlabens xiamenensis]